MPRSSRSGKDVLGLYHSGAGSAGIGAALARHGREQSVVWVGHELSDAFRGATSAMSYWSTREARR
jgi:LacI family transcriptional regulator